MTSRWLTTAGELAALAPAWDGALARAAADNPFLLTAFLLAWCRSFAPADRLRILTLWDHDTLVGGLPLYLARRRGVPVLRSIGIGFAGLSEPWHLVAAPEFAAEAARALRRLPGWRYLNLPLSRTAWLEGNGSLSVRTMSPMSGTRARLGGADFNAYLAGLEPGVAAKLGRCERRAAALGGAFTEAVLDPGALDQTIEFQLRHNGPARYPADAVVTRSRAAWADFTRRLLRHFASIARLQAFELRLGRDPGERAAVGFGLRMGPGFNYVLTAYDPRFARLSPGFLLFAGILRRCCAAGAPYLDAYGVGQQPEGSGPGLRRWCNDFPPLHTQRVYSADLAGRALRAWGRAWNR